MVETVALVKVGSGILALAQTPVPGTRNLRNVDASVLLEVTLENVFVSS